MATMHRIPPFNPQQLEAIARILADTAEGLTGTEIGYILSDCRIPDVSPDMTKWKRLFNAFVAWQNDKQLGNCVVMFLTRAMNPVNYTACRERFASRQAQLNAVLALCGFSIGDDGKLRYAQVAKNLDEAAARADRLHSLLESRKVHRDVLAFCKAELVQKNYFHAVFEAMKSIASKIQKLSGLTGDGAELVQQAFGMPGGKAPVLAINTLATETHKGEQRGFANLLIGLFGPSGIPSLTRRRSNGR